MDAELRKNWMTWEQNLDDEPVATMGEISARTVLKAHYLLAEYFREQGQAMGGVGPRSAHLLESAVSRQFVGLGGVRKWKDLYEVAATLLFGLIKNHAFYDGNKRTALLVLLHQLKQGGRVPSAPKKHFEDLAVRIAENQLRIYPAFRELRASQDSEVEFLARFLRKNTRRLDTREFRLTYRQLAAILARFDYHFGDPHDNRIDILQWVEESSGVFRRKARRTEKRIATLGFRDWGTEVSQKDIRHMRNATELTLEAGFDTGVLMQDLEPMELLIEEYKDPLRRLARK